MNSDYGEAHEVYSYFSTSLISDWYFSAELHFVAKSLQTILNHSQLNRASNFALE